jgi:D-amino peptidase
MEGTRNGVLAHTYSPYAFRAIRVNDIPVGEIALDASVAGALGVPLLFLSSDDKGCDEGRRFMPWIETVTTKQGLGRNCAHSKHPAVVEEEIHKAVTQAVERLPEMRPFAFDLPARLEIQFMTVLQAVKARIRRRTWHLAGPRTLRTTVSTMRDWRC